MSWSEELHFSLQALAELLRDEKTLSAYEVHTSNMVEVLLHCLTGQFSGSVMSWSKVQERKNMFCTVFSEVDHNTRWDHTYVRTSCDDCDLLLP